MYQPKQGYPKNSHLAAGLKYLISFVSMAAFFEIV